MDKPNILIFLSDQHSPNYINAMGNKLIKTPNIDSISKNGLSFINAYTSCPLCVPSRSSFLTSKLPSSTGIFTNDNSLASDELTFLHSLGANGYETVLCGRMHFVGEDQKHGFTKRICKDITIDTWGSRDNFKKELGCFSGTLAAKGCLNKVGKGVSPVLEYDVAVINKAIKYLQQEHEKPQLLVVGTYAPHFSYVAPKEEYEYYFNNLDDSELNNYNDIQYYTAMNDEMQNCPVEKLRKIRAAYYGMITNLDKQIGKVRKAWNEYNNRNNSKSIFIYMSDHGDQIGQRKLFGKKSFYEDSVRIPLFIEGDNIPKNKKIFDPVSIMDIGPSICEYTNSEIFDYIDGKTLNQRLNNKENIIISEFIAVLIQSQYLEEWLDIKIIN